LAIINMMKTKIFLLLLVVGTFTSCDKKQKLKDQIATLESQSPVDNSQSRMELAKAYISYANQFPSDSLAEQYHHSAVAIATSSKNHESAVQYGNEFLDKFPNSPIKDEVVLLIARSYFHQGNSDSAVALFESVPMGSSFASTDLHYMKKAYLLFLKDHPKDERSIDYSIKAANLLAESGSANKAVDLLLGLVKNHPDSEFSPYALMRSADILEVQSKNLPEAETTLKRLIEEYPESNFARDARIILEKGLLGLSDEEKFARITGQNPS